MKMNAAHLQVPLSAQKETAGKGEEICQKTIKSWGS